VRVTTEFTRLLKLPSATVTAVKVADGEVVIGIRSRTRKLTCPCGYQTRAAYDKSRRRWRHLDLATSKTWLVADIRRLNCPTCGVRTEQVPWARPRARHTQAFEDQTVWLAKRADKTPVATLMRCSWAAVSASTVISDVLGASQLTPLAQGRGVRIATDHQRKALAIRDKGCVIPGCDIEASRTEVQPQG